MRVISLFSGIGGLDLGLRAVFPEARTIAYVECEPFCQRILRARMADGRLDAAPIFDDVREFKGTETGGADWVIGGFPCQDLSYAGKGAGLDGERSGLWREFARIIGVVRPRFVLLENVPAILTRGGVRVVADLAAIGYRATWTLIRAADAGAPILRERFFCLARSDEIHGPQGLGIHPEPPREAGALLGSPDGQRDGVWTLPAPDALGSLDGVPDWMDRSSALGNAVVPAQAALALRVLWERLR